MAESYDISIKLIGNQSPCHYGHKVGEEWLWSSRTPENLCFFAYNSLAPFAHVLQYGGNFPWQENPDIITAGCPDSEVFNVFELKRVPEKGEKAGYYDISIKLVGKDKDNPCDNGHKVGDEWLWQYAVPENMCHSAYEAIFIPALVMKYGGQFPWQEDPDVTTVTCPDPNVGNKFEIRRIPVK
jgi:uncharacterized repeat protein (TIGR04076 family)